MFINQQFDIADIADGFFLHMTAYGLARHALIGGSLAEFNDVLFAQLSC